MPIEIKASGHVCRRCGNSYGKLSGNFLVCYGALYKGAGYLPYCNHCVEDMYMSYLRQCGDQQAALRQLCRKLDLYWSAELYESILAKTTPANIVKDYIAKLRGKNCIGKSFDNTLIEAGTMWDDVTDTKQVNEVVDDAEPEQAVSDEDIEVPDEIKDRFGSGYTNQMYLELNRRYNYWMKRLPPDVDKDDIGVQALTQQLCAVELDINRLRAQGQSVDKYINTFQSLLGRLMTDPVKKKEEDANTALANTPLGVWLYRYEKQRPLPEVPDELQENRIKKYIFTWMGHVLKMLGVKNGFTKLYEEEVARYRVERPEYADEDDESLLIDAWSETAPISAQEKESPVEPI